MKALLCISVVIGAHLGAGAQESVRKPQADPREHWAFKPPTRPAIPAVTHHALHITNPIDAFVLVELERRGLAPSPEARKEVLLRRVYIDLIGLPPTRAELRDFLADNSPDAYEKVVNRLLGSPQ